MYETTIKKNKIKFKINSNLLLIENVINNSKQFICSMGAVPTHEFEIVQRELLTNAIYHGNNRNPGLKVICIITVGDKQELIMTVEDEGEGFHYESLNMSAPLDPRSNVQRGYVLIKAFTESISFKKSGAQATVTMQLEAAKKQEIMELDTAKHDQENNRNFKINKQFMTNKKSKEVG